MPVMMRGPIVCHNERTYCMPVMMRGPSYDEYCMPVMVRGPIVCQL